MSAWNAGGTMEHRPHVHDHVDIPVADARIALRGTTEHLVRADLADIPVADGRIESKSTTETQTPCVHSSLNCLAGT